MKLLFVAIALASILTTACASIDVKNAEPNLKQTVSLAGTGESAMLPNLVSSDSDQNASVFGRAEVDSLRTAESRVLAQSELGDIKVGAVGGNEVIYILVVVLLVVVIIKVL